MTNPIDPLSSATAVSGASSPFTQARQDAMSAAATELGMSAADLRSALANGETLSQLAAAKGVSAADLQNTIEAALKKDLPNASDTQVSGMANRMMSGAHHAHGGHGAHAHAASRSSASASASSGVDASTDGNVVGSNVNITV